MINFIEPVNIEIEDISFFDQDGGSGIPRWVWIIIAIFALVLILLFINQFTNTLPAVNFIDFGNKKNKDDNK